MMGIATSLGTRSQQFRLTLRLGNMQNQDLHADIRFFPTDRFVASPIRAISTAIQMSVTSLQRNVPGRLTVSGGSPTTERLVIFELSRAIRVTQFSVMKKIGFPIDSTFSWQAV
jgi:hypothetical protein